ncbi:two-component sensor histidine kinase [Aureimonas endophytica]|uniref:histidine kinase n=1 Tax=Aureimonas endophytica TaxID=2027858 RepID=A0A916ZQX9_9HYPH|nr:ATP-binding protein [Aureimonas endophytica]GGE08364.1 two-component sensor histidine kinase [Aureimonas endophytica]
MITLRLRLALVFVAAIVTVVVVAVFMTFQFVRGPHDGTLERALVDDATTIARLLDHSPDRARAAGIAVVPAPDPRLADRESMRGTVWREDVMVLAGPKEERRLLIRLTDREWAELPYPTRPPSPILTLSAYLSMVVVGTTAIAFLVAARLMGPMRLLEGALASIRPDGTLPRVPERGPPEVRATARVLNALSDRLKAAMESRMRLIAAAGHDLRTPMTRLRLRAEFLPEGERATWLGDLDELDHIADSAIRLVREEADETTFALLPLGALAACVVAEIGEIGLPARFEGGPEVAAHAQPLALKRALRNLVENAARHGGGAVVRLERRDDRALVVIEDRGPGIPEALLDRVFEPFFRVDAARRKLHPGAGLGLAIAHEIVERHRGTLAIRNRTEGGLRQEMSLPAAG